MKRIIVLLAVVALAVSANAAIVMTGGDAGEGLTVNAGSVVAAYNFAWTGAPVTIQGVEFADDIHNPWSTVITAGGGAFATFPLWGGLADIGAPVTADDTSMLDLGNSLFYADHDAWIELSNLTPGAEYQIDIMTSLAGFAGPRGLNIWTADNWGDPLNIVDTFEATATNMYNTTFTWTADADGQLYVGTVVPDAGAYAYSEGAWINGLVVSEVPEPATMMLLGLGGLLVRKRS